MRIGVLSLQGAFLEHIKAIEQLGVKAVKVRLPQDLDNISGLIIPGGESTVIGKLMSEYGFIKPLKLMIKNGFPVYGTCAGLILLAKDIGNTSQPTLGIMDITVERNAFGRQIDSFEENIIIKDIGNNPFRAIFIRAPIIRAAGQKVKVLARLNDATIVAAEEKNILVTSFHPELTDDLRIHKYFLNKVEEFS